MVSELISPRRFTDTTPSDHSAIRAGGVGRCGRRPPLQRLIPLVLAEQARIGHQTLTSRWISSSVRQL